MNVPTMYVANIKNAKIYATKQQKQNKQGARIMKMIFSVLRKDKRAKQTYKQKQKQLTSLLCSI